ncbi:hypothetical protein J2Z62_000562 [Mycoplasmoides fastidiosum]|uniref:Uncharacterized protein n=1 Tax=Mycoplasmoides fastidiosum TaxID=92758 RepID=A0ABU0LZM3_9BACT|nr:hypothetical protein [Mycoplasmoides fastidiosum]MDQ0514124.1 hypothetical protein [Mycoplasmoides fastidiosum]UUD37468.1 hypothetical protein NPA10_02760 [Mycoplasmoides fastidiosum]
MLHSNQKLNFEQKALKQAGAAARVLNASARSLSRINQSPKVPGLKATRSRSRTATLKSVAAATAKTTRTRKTKNNLEPTDQPTTRRGRKPQSLIEPQLAMSTSTTKLNDSLATVAPTSSSGYLRRTFDKLKNGIKSVLYDPKSKSKTTLGMSNGRLYQLGVWPMAVAASAVGLISNIQTANEIMNEKPEPQQIYYDRNGQQRVLYSRSATNYSELERRKNRYAVVASKMQPFLRIRANPNDSAISFGAPWFF